MNRCGALRYGAHTPQRLLQSCYPARNGTRPLLAASSAHDHHKKWPQATPVAV
ncbi:uncharacterized protein ATNIH1004_003497 [Aspergillus tanneri]|uniref:Uncharacterized protein n=1 Tax=Aspergillus tanneri TaxID=1220188 RepID=A0A5M9MVA0_9EURO|nr:uncharacterized protein ATNIH1004_003497 [Aspergillus tanneri]KAA8650808.1 hypothetical protein ATNIH1004_003497 [Aspergillus tanneri]